MYKVIIGLQFSALIPVIVILIYKPNLNLFFRLLLASILLSLFSDLLGNYCVYKYQNSLPVLSIYNYLSAILITLLWQKTPFYPDRIKNQVRYIGYSFLGAMIITSIVFKFDQEGFYILSCLNIFLGLVLALQYYHQKIILSTYTPLLRDPYFITASSFILLCFSTIIILAAQLHFIGKPFVLHTWVLKQIFYLVYNILIGYAFYVLSKIQQIQ